MPRNRREVLVGGIADVVSTTVTTSGTTWTLHDEHRRHRENIWYRWANSATTTGTTGNWLIADQCSWATGGSTTANNLVWSTAAWQQADHRAVYAAHRDRIAKQTPAEVARIAAEAEIYRQEQVRRAEFKVASVGRARNLLENFLTPEQKKMLGLSNFFEVTVHGKDGQDRRYRIEYGFQGNVKLLDAAGLPVRRFCIHSDSRLPYEDQMLAQKLLLEANEDEFLRIANKTELAFAGR